MQQCCKFSFLCGRGFERVCSIVALIVNKYLSIVYRYSSFGVLINHYNNCNPYNVF